MTLPRTLLATLLLTPALALAQAPDAPAAEEGGASPPPAAAASPHAGTGAEAAARTSPATDAPAAPRPPPGWERVSGAGKAQAPIEAPPLVVAAYVVIWLATLLYVLYLWRRQVALVAEIDALKARLEEIDRAS